MLKLDLENGLHYNKTNWVLRIKNILEECGLTYLRQNQPYISIHFHTIKQRILDIYYQAGYTSSNNSTRLQTYNLFKHIFKQEEYLDFIKEKQFRKTPYSVFLPYCRMNIVIKEIAFVPIL